MMLRTFYLLFASVLCYLSFCALYRELKRRYDRQLITVYAHDKFPKGGIRP